MRSVRQVVFGALLPAVRPLSWQDLRTFMIINEKWVFTPDELNRVSAAQLKQQLRTHLNRIGVTADSGFFLAFLHGEFDPVAGLYTLHFHGVCTAEVAEVLDQLTEKKWGYVPTRTGANSIVRKEISAPARQLSYLLKAFWPAKAVRHVDGPWKRDRKGQRIPEPYHT